MTKFIKTFTFLSCLVAVICMMDGVVMLLANGVVQQFNYTATWIEYAWLLVALTAFVIFILCKLPAKAILVPLSYIAWISIGTVLAIVLSLTLYSQVKDTAHYAWPPWMPVSSIAFGIYYLIANITLIRFLSSKKEAQEPGSAPLAE